MRAFVLFLLLSLSAQASAQANDFLREPAPAKPTVSTGERLVLELGGAVLGTLVAFAIAEGGTRALSGDPMLTTEHGSLELDPFTMSGAYYGFFAPFIVSTAVSLVG